MGYPWPQILKYFGSVSRRLLVSFSLVMKLSNGVTNSEDGIDVYFPGVSYWLFGHQKYKGK